MESFKKCPLKKRPVIIKNYKLMDNYEEPQDLSIKSDFYNKNRHFDLSSNSYYDSLRKNDFGIWYKPYDLPLSPIHDTYTKSDLDGIPEENYLPQIHLRGLTNMEVKKFYYDSYYCPEYQEQSRQIYPEEYVTVSLTPPSSPNSSMSLEPEDLSVPKFSIESLLYSPAKKRSYILAPKLRKYQENYRFTCDKCQKSYSTGTGLSKHQQLHCPAAECNKIKREFGCKTCDKVYTSLGALKMHIRTHTLPCKCPHCGKAFSRPWLLQGHIRTHTGEKPFSCNHCQRAFADRSNLRAHQQTHVEVKKYICKNCSKSFSRMSLLSKHMAGASCGIRLQPYL